MSRNTAGTYTLPVSGNPVVSGTSVSSTWANATLSDVATEVTNSLDRQGRGAMLAPLAVQDGSASLPSYTFASETNSGLYRAGSEDVRMVVDGAQVQKWNAGSTTITGLVTDTATINGNVTLAGSNPAASTAFANTVTKKNVAKAWASISTDGLGGITLLDGFNIASVSISTTTITVTFAQAFANGNYAACISESSTSYLASVAGVTRVAASCQFNFVNFPAGTVRNPSANQVIFSVVFYGQQ